MKSYSNNKPAIQQPWLRVILYVVLYFLLLVAFTFILQLATGSTKEPGYRIIYLGVAVSAIVSLAFTWLFRKLVDRQSFASLGFAFNKNGHHAAVGFFLGIFLLCTGSLILYFTGNLQWTDFSFNGQDIFTGLILMVIVAVYEEVIFRGYILHNLLQSLNKWVALVITAILFALAHIGNPGITVLAVLNIFAAGLLLGVNYLYTRNLWFAMMLHFSWNFFQGPVLGFGVSGVNIKSILEPELHGNALLTGGPFGLEGSLIALILYIIAIATLLLVYEKKYIAKNQL
jgi:membrane protease YdiL (CAAX protease family)